MIKYLTEVKSVSHSSRSQQNFLLFLLSLLLLFIPWIKNTRSTRRFWVVPSPPAAYTAKFEFIALIPEERTAETGSDESL